MLRRNMKIIGEQKHLNNEPTGGDVTCVFKHWQVTEYRILQASLSLMTLNICFNPYNAVLQRCVRLLLGWAFFSSYF